MNSHTLQTSPSTFIQGIQAPARSWNNSVNTGTWLRAVWPWNQSSNLDAIRGSSVHHSLQRSTGSHGSFLEGKTAGTWSSHLHLLPCFRHREATIHLPHTYA